ncbi:MAG TPA: hypothetical protein VFO16_24085, partial [Pseudonocardiaceae bacterium]|nr:hypothetical protein [Pseudonocardiaceae bacterium]
MTVNAEDNGRVLPVARVLPPEEWERLLDVGPFHNTGVIPDPRFALVVVLEDPATQRIVGTWEVTSIGLLEGLHLEPDYRHSTAAASRLFFKMMNVLRDHHVKTVLTVTQDEMVRRLA